MNLPDCEFEGNILQALATGDWPEELRHHADSCPACSDVLLVAGFLQAEQSQTAAASPLPDAGRAWWTAQRRLREEKVRRATRPIALVERISLGLAALGGIAALLWLWPELKAGWGWLQLAWKHVLPAAAPSASQMLFLGGGLLLLVLLFGVYVVWAED